MAANHVFGKTSSERLATVEPRLEQVVRLALKKCDIDFMVLEGVRSRERQQELYGQGRTAAQMVRVGLSPKLARPSDKQVTWTLQSNHFADPKTGRGRAVDLCPYPVDWDSLWKFDAIAKAMFAAAKELNVNIRWGADWDDDGNPRERGETDSPHFELED